MKLFTICRRVSATCLVLAVMASATWAQRVITSEEYEAWRAEREAEIMRQRMARENERFKRESEWRRNNRANDRANDRATTPDASASPSRPMTAEHKRRLYPTEAERASFAALLRADGTGLMRLLPHTNCVADPRIVNASGKCLEQVPPVRGGGAFYSFRDKKYHYAADADIALRDNLFNVGFMRYTVGLLAAVGDVPLEAVTLQTEAVRPFLKFVPALTQEETERAFKRSRAWLEVPRYSYGATAPVSANTTYVMRSIDFSPGRKRPSDVFVAFRVTRRDADGAVTVLWKQLQKPKK